MALIADVDIRKKNKNIPHKNFSEKYTDATSASVQINKKITPDLAQTFCSEGFVFSDGSWKERRREEVCQSKTSAVSLHEAMSSTAALDEKFPQKCADATSASVQVKKDPIAS